MTRTYRVTDRYNGAVQFIEAESPLAAVEKVAARGFRVNPGRPAILDLDAEEA